jgi:hypothetical protein
MGGTGGAGTDVVNSLVGEEYQYESVDGCPLVRLDDKVKDWLVVLEAIYDPV